MATSQSIDRKKPEVQSSRGKPKTRGLDSTGSKLPMEAKVEALASKFAPEDQLKTQAEAKKDVVLDMSKQAGTEVNGEKVDAEKETDLKPVNKGNASAGDVLPSTEGQSSKGASEAVGLSTSEGSAQGGNSRPIPTDLEKKQKRAERFGLGLMVSEGEKRRLRAARFGNDTDKASENSSQEGNKLSPTGKEAEAVKRKARAARFGIEEVPSNGPESSAVSSSTDDARKKARLARFGNGISLDPREQEKKKLRAARFGLETGVEKKVDSVNSIAVAPPTAS